MAPHAESIVHDSGHGVKPTIDVPVLIVGSGPTGLLMGYMLSQLGVRTLIIERYATRLRAPKAHALSPRSLELCRQFSLDVNEIRALGTNRKDAYCVNFYTSMAGQYVQSLPYERMDPEVLAATPTMIHNISQPIFEEYVAAHIEGRKDIEIRRNQSFRSCEQWPEYVSTTVEDRDNGRDYKIRSRHVIACDGAKSRVRAWLNIASEGESSYETMMTIHFNANLRDAVGSRVGMLHWIFDPDVSGFIISYDLDGNQVLICNFDSTKHPLESWNVQLCQEKVQTAIGKDIPFEVLSYRPWALNRKVAESYMSGRVILAGDAAHSFPPTGGLGLNSGLADVHNLAYKVAAVHQGWAGPKILDTYEAERRQVALVNAGQSFKNGQKVFSLLRKMGTIDADAAKARENLRQRLANLQTRCEVLKGVEEQREHFDNLGLHIGYVYGEKEIPASASLFIPSYRPGARMPHTWISADSTCLALRRLPPIDSSYVAELGLSEVAARKYSTLDLCSFAAFTLIIATPFRAHWDEQILCVKERLPKKVAALLKINTVALGTDFRLVPGARADEWANGLQLDRGCGVMVRPDQHILEIFGIMTSVEDITKTFCTHLDL